MYLELYYYVFRITSLLCIVFSRLRNLQLEAWGNSVTVVSCDMRKWQAPEKVSLL